jgi:ion channel-forming bestrophin family protein
MINYNPKDWSFFIFKMHKADTFKKLLPMIIYISIYSSIVIFLMKHYLPEHLIAYDKNLSIMHSLLGFVISMLLVFRTNTAYDRWWEGRKVWGSLINTSRNLFIKFTNIINDKEKTMELNTSIVEFAHAFKSHLRKNKKEVSVAKTKHIPLEVTNKLYKEVCLLHINKKINDSQFLVLNNDLQLLMDYTGMCERIRNTPIPFIYNMFIKKFIFFYVMTLPFAFAFNLSYAGIPVSAFIFYVLASLETIAEEIEDPFGIDANDLPLEVYVNTIEKSKEEMKDHLL